MVVVRYPAQRPADLDDRHVASCKEDKTVERKQIFLYAGRVRTRVRAAMPALVAALIIFSQAVAGVSAAPQPAPAGSGGASELGAFLDTTITQQLAANHIAGA